VARIEFSTAAVEDLVHLESTHSLPHDTRDRVRRSVRALARFPRLGRLLEGGGWDGFRFVLGPWRWMVIVCQYDEAADRVVVVTVQDGRASTAARNQ
jgi:plasmid stabilization system protein ParE